jgi:sigma-E factor negative regulatory protein RseC
MPGDRVEKIISADFEGNMNTGDNVNVTIEEKFSWIAVFFSFLLPFIVLIASFLISLQIINNDIISAVIGIGMLIPYYAILFLFKRSFQKRFLFKAVKI